MSGPPFLLFSGCQTDVGQEPEFFKTGQREILIRLFELFITGQTQMYVRGLEAL